MPSGAKGLVFFFGKVEALRLLNPRPLGRVKGRALIFTSEAKRPMGGPEGYAEDGSVVDVAEGKKKETSLAGYERTLLA